MGWQWYDLKYGETKSKILEGSLLMGKMVVMSASIQNLGGIDDSISKVLTTSKRWWFFHSTTLFCYGI